MRPEGMTDLQYVIWGFSEYKYVTFTFAYAFSCLFRLWMLNLRDKDKYGYIRWDWKRRVFIFLGFTPLIVYWVFLFVRFIWKEGYIKNLTEKLKNLGKKTVHFSQKALVSAKILYLQADTKLSGRTHTREINGLRKKFQELE